MTNKLSSALSPYLLEHAHNPVNWYPWGKEALDLAKQTNKPILLSIGYSACHWCHVMAYESFEDTETAALMNQLFVNIKVDREERPDLDKVYQLAHQLITQRSGGWPLTVFLTPDEHIPFFAGTYFPKEIPAPSMNFKQILQYIAQAYREKRKDIQHLSETLHQAFTELSRTNLNNNIVITDEPVQEAIKQLRQDFDSENGGFGTEPKFPHPLQCDFLLAIYQRSNDPLIKEILEKTLDNMAYGGIYDQLGGGFFRYSTDSYWEIPHFEKMLYDSALLLSTYCKAYEIFRHPLYKRIIQETASWLIDSMQDKNGGFYSTLNADSAGTEGGYYLWDIQEYRNILSDQEYMAIKHYFNVDETANFENKWHLYVKNEELYNDTVKKAKQTLLRERKKRLPPSCDTKQLCSWNALAIKALYQAGHCLGEKPYTEKADLALQVWHTHFLKHGKLFAAYKDEHCYLEAYLDDYAFLLDAVLEKIKQNASAGAMEYLDFANHLATILIKHFYDKTDGAFFFTSDLHEQLIYRPKTLLDDALPAGNSVAVSALWQLGQLTGEKQYSEIAMTTIKSCWEYLKVYPAAHCSLVSSILHVNMKHHAER